MSSTRAVSSVCVYDIKLISASVRWSPIGRCRGDYAPTIAAGDCIGEEVVVEVGERGCRWATGAGETASLVRSISVVMCARCAREAAEGRPGVLSNNGELVLLAGKVTD